MVYGSVKNIKVYGIICNFMYNFSLQLQLISLHASNVRLPLTPKIVGSFACTSNILRDYKLHLYLLYSFLGKNVYQKFTSHNTYAYTQHYTLRQPCFSQRYETMPDSDTQGKDYRDVFLGYLPYLRGAYAPISHLFFCLRCDGDIILCASNSLALSPELQDKIKLKARDFNSIPQREVKIYQGEQIQIRHY